jgi:hypothetical protein
MTEKLKECHHGHSSQKTNQLNSISRYTSRKTGLFASQFLASRICLAVGIDSVGPGKVLPEGFGRMNMKLPENTRLMLQRMRT